MFSVVVLCQGLTLQAMKFAIAAIYTNYRSVIVDAPAMVLTEGFTGRPRGGKLDLQFQEVASQEVAQVRCGRGLDSLQGSELCVCFGTVYAVQISTESLSEDWIKTYISSWSR